jgi:hypothetical protein
MIAVLSELSMEVARNSDLTPDEVFRRLASLPRETVMDEASRLVERQPVAERSLSRQLGNDGGYRSSRAGVSGRLTRRPVEMAAPAAVETTKDGRNRIGLGALRTAF